MLIGIARLPELTHNYIEAIRAAAGLTAPPLSAPPAASPFLRHIREQQRCLNPKIEVSLSPSCAARWDALVLPGGGDIDPALLPGNPPPDPRCHDIDPELDRRQLALLELFVQKRKPVLGICKGMQLICLYFGGGLSQHLPTAETHRYKECDQFHPTHAARGSFLFDLYGGRFAVNSAHHQGVLVPDSAYTSDCPVPSLPGRAQLFSAGSPQSAASLLSSAHPFPLSVIQTAEDGVAEGLVHKTLPIIGLQWHPERLCRAFWEKSGKTASASHDFFPGGQMDCPVADGALVFQHFLSLC